VKVLVTGASGLVGSKICDYFISNGINVIAVSHNIVVEISSPLLKHYSLDLTISSQELIIEKCDVIIHCAAKIPTSNNLEINQSSAHTNRLIDDAIVDLSLKWASKLIYFSTAYLYSENLEGDLNENSEINSNLKDYYFEKYESEKKVMNSKMNYCIFRISSPYGNIKKQKNVMRLFFDKAINNESIVLFGNGERKQNFIHINDIAKACLIAIKNNIIGTYHLTGNNYTTMKELANEIISNTRSTSAIICDTSIADKDLNVRFNNDLLLRRFNWKSEISLNEGIKLML